MRKLILPIASSAILAAGITMSGGFAARGAKTRQHFPPNPEMIYQISQPDFNKWFVSGTPSLNGAVKPADSINLNTNNPNISFYLWSYQMFLWLTSPASGAYGGSGRIFFSPVFYDVSPKNKAGYRTLTRFSGGPLNFAVRVNEPGPDGLTMAHDKLGHVFEVAKARVSSSGHPLIKNAAGKLVEVGRIRLVRGSRKPVFLDLKGSPIAKARPLLTIPSGKVPILQRLIVRGKSFFIDPNGTAFDVSPDQADGGVQLTQKGALMYYSIAVNDVYAYFLTQNYPQSSSTTLKFPTTGADVASIQQYAKQHGGPTFPDPEALAIEVKSAWVDAAAVPNPHSYITTFGNIPTYTHTSSTTWTPTGKTERRLLALVGMHVVGSTKGHPEMVWSTFEHFGNTPNTAYQYVSSQTGHPTVTMPAQISGSWLFAPGHSVSNDNVPMAVPGNGGTIVANSSLSPVPPIGPSNAIRYKPFGAAWDNLPTNPVAASAAISNSQVLSINKTVSTKMPVGDIRDQYYFGGSLWTEGGASPTTPYPGPPPSHTGGNVVGTGQLTNSTMETFMETSPANGGTGSGYANSGCFACHNTNTVQVSHIYLHTLPLFK